MPCRAVLYPGNVLDELGIADNTYLIFTSDNGYHLGAFGLEGKVRQSPVDTHSRNTRPQKLSHPPKHSFSLKRRELQLGNG